MEKTYYRLSASDVKQEKWLNELARNGWKLTSRAFLQFIFEPCDPIQDAIGVITLDRGLRGKKGKAFIQNLIDQGCTITYTYGSTIYYNYSGDNEELKKSQDFIDVYKNHFYSNLTFFILYLILTVFILINGYKRAITLNSSFFTTQVILAWMWLLLSLTFLKRALQSFLDMKRRLSVK